MAGARTADVKFRASIRATMLMGLPNQLADLPTFHFPDLRTWAHEDSSEEPWDWKVDRDMSNNPDPEVPTGSPPQPDVIFGIDATGAVASTMADGILVCSIDPGGVAAMAESPVGPFDPQTIVLGMFEDEWAAVNGGTLATNFSTVTFSSKLYTRAQVLPVVSLFGVDFRQVVVNP